MKHLIVFALLVLVGCATGKATEEVTLSDKAKAMCDAEGGCRLFTKDALQAQLEEAFVAGFEARAALEAKKRGAL